MADIIEAGTARTALLLDLAGQLVDAAQQAGADEAEAFATCQRSRAARATGATLNWTRDAEICGVGLRTVRHGALGYAYRSTPGRLTTAECRELAVEALDIAAITGPVGRAGPLLPAPEADPPPVPGLYYEAAAGWDIAEVRGALAELSAAALAVPGVIEVPRNHYGSETSEVAVASSHGIHTAYAGTLRYQWAEVIAEQDGEIGTGNHAQWTRGDSPLDSAAIGALAGRRSRDHSGAAPVPPGRYPVVLAPQAAVNLVSKLGVLLNAQAVQHRRSMFQEPGATVASAAVTVVDDPTIPGGLDSCPFDAEGVPARRRTLITDGVLTGLLHDCGTAAVAGLGQQAAGNAVRSSYRAMPCPGPANLHIAPGRDGPAQLHQQAGDGLLIEELIGLHAADPVTGKFGASARGRVLTGGVAGRPVSDIAVSGSYQDLLARIAATGDDLTFLPGKSGLGSPSLLLTELAVSGSADSGQRSPRR
jgi:PmbA protein